MSKMEEEYNWSLILAVAVPFALAEAYIFSTGLKNAWKWAILVIGLLSAGGIVYAKDKRKANIFTAVAIVFLAVLLVKFLKEFL